MSFKLFRFNVLLILLALQLTNCTNKTPRNNQFGAYYTNIECKNNITGKYADIVVKIGDNKEFVFCKESCYLPYLKIGEEKWYVDKLIKINNDGTETKPEIFNKYSYVRIIKNTSEQIIVHWRYIPDLINIKGAKSSGYEREQKAFPILALAPDFSFTIDAAEDSPIQNPCFEIDNWNPKNKAIIKINGKAVKESKSFRQGICLNETGREKLII